MHPGAAVIWLGIATMVNAAAAPDVHSIIERSVAANQAAWKVAPDYAFDQRERETDGTKSYRVTMLLGSPYSRLIAVNGMPLSKDEDQTEQQRFQRELARRQAESAAERRNRIARYEDERERDHVLLEQLTEAFDFTLVGREQMGSRAVYHVRATPRDGYSPPNLHARALVGMRGDLWIDAATFNWVKVRAVVTHPVTIAGFLARVEPGTYFELEYMPVANGVWLPKHFSMQAHSEILGVFRHRSQEDTTYSNYRRTISSTKANLFN